MMKFYILTIVLIVTIYHNKFTTTSPCDKQYIKYLTLYSCTYPKRKISLFDILHLPLKEVNKRFETLLGKNSAKMFENWELPNWNNTIKNTTNSKFEIERLKTILLRKNNRQKRKAQSGGYLHLGQMAKDFDYWHFMQDETPFKATELMKLMWQCCTSDIPCYVSNFSRIC
uniref:Uncharacterized protein n=1 Tax=Rhodnius prolixus TaxID=13249 RepID=A0A4P6D9M7_RHOPR